MSDAHGRVCRDWYEFLDNHRPRPPLDWNAVEAALLEHGGDRVIEGYALDTERAHLVERGCLRDPPAVDVQEMKASECHFNSARLWMSKYDEAGGRSGNAANWHIVTGYGLSDDGLWREHTWVERADGSIVETTVPRDAYYGVQLDNHDEALSFCAGERVYPASD